jgi:hypothetical protein
MTKMADDKASIWLAAGVRTAFVGVDGPFAHRDSLTLSVPVVQAMAERANGPIDFAVWGAVIPQSGLRQSGARGVAGGQAQSARAHFHDHHAMQHEHGRRV